MALARWKGCAAGGLQQRHGERRPGRLNVNRAPQLPVFTLTVPSVRSKSEGRLQVSQTEHASQSGRHIYCGRDRRVKAALVNVVVPSGGDLSRHTD